MTMTLALPSKGRLKDKALALLKHAGLEIIAPSNSRNYRAKIANLPGCEVSFLSASEIARDLSNGSLDLGITGQDLIYETHPDPNRTVTIELPLGFGFADVVVAVPAVWHDVSSMADLDDIAAEFRHRRGRRLRVATKFWRLTQQFFSQKYGIQVYRIVESLGATEGAPAAGTADVIVDITSSGATLQANKLKVLDDGLILKSQACLVSSKKSDKQVAINSVVETVRASLSNA